MQVRCLFYGAGCRDLSPASSSEARALLALQRVRHHSPEPDRSPGAPILVLGDGTVIDGFDIPMVVRAVANNITIKNSRIRADGWEPIFAFEDQIACVEMYRRNGVPCAHVNDEEHQYE